MISWLGGRKSFLVLGAMLLVATRHLIGLDADDVQLLVVLALGGSGAIALEDTAGKIVTRQRSKSRPHLKPP